MKQKRKETGLSSSKIGLNVLGVVCLVAVLGGILCLASIGLLGKSAIAAGNNSDKKLSYTGVDDTSEVVYKVSFIETENTQERELKETDFSNVYREGKNLYVTPGNVVVNRKSLGGEEISHSNKVLGDNVYGHILGGDENELSSENVTIIAGRQNIVAENNSAATVLGGQENGLLAGNGSRTAILVGGYGNHIKTSNEGVTIIGGKDNNVEPNASDVVILGGEGSSVDGNSTIVGGSKVSVPNGVTDIFAFSDGVQNGGLNVSTSDEGSKAFYLEVSKGLGINADPSTNGIDAGGAVGFGAIDLNDTDTECNPNNYGLQGTYNGCLMGCTVAGWELLDTSDECRDVCKSLDPKCVDKDQVDPEKKEGECEGNLIVKDGTDGNKNRMHLCPGLNAANFWDTTFEKVLIDSKKDCPTNPNGGDPIFGDNQCVYQCNTDFHIIENNIDMPSKGLVPGEKGCYQSCKRGVDESGNEKIIDHGETSFWYAQNKVSCAYDSDSPRSEYTCGNVKAELICVDGELYTMKNGKPDQPDTEHMYATCRLDGYTSCGGSYPFRASWVQGGNYPNSGSLPTSDRESATLSRGEYKLCVDFNGQETTGTNEDCSPVTPDPNHYQLVGCNNGYTRFSSTTGQPDDNGDECRKNCGNEKDGTILNLYRKANPQCTSTDGENCASVTIKCFDGDWKEINNGSVVSGPVNRSDYSTTCAVGPVCGAGENISGILGLLSSAGIAGLTKVDTCYPSGTQNCTNPHKIFGGCNGDSHVEKRVSYTEALGHSQTNNGINRYCIPNERTVKCTKIGKPSTDDTEYIEKETQQNWVGTWNSGKWYPESEICAWRCKDLNKVPVLSGGTYICVTPEKDCGGTKPSWGVETGPSKYLSGDTPNNWQSGYVSSISGALKGCQWTCKDGYEYKDSYGCRSKCGNGTKDVGEECDPNDSSKKGWGDSGCSSSCKKLESGACAATTTGYNECSFSIQALSNGESTIVLTTTPGKTGSITATCSNGTVSYSGKSCNDIPSGDCAKTTTGYNGCSFSIPALSNGASTGVNTTTSGKTGSITAKCSNGTVSISGKSCYDAGGYVCTDEPEDAILVTGTNLGLTGNTKGRLVAFKYEVKSSDKCIYKCDHSKNMYYYNDGEKPDCIELTDICSEIEYKCNGLGVEVKNKNTSKHTWECRADGEKVKTCNGTGDVETPKCKYGGSGPACETGSVADQKGLTNGCGYEWTCKNGDKSTKCMMKYDQPVNVETQYIMRWNTFPNSDFERTCKNLVPSSTQVLLNNRSMIESDARSANQAIGNYGVMLQNDPENNRWMGNACTYSTSNGDRYCMACIGYDIETKYDYDKIGVCYIKDDSGKEVNSSYNNCKGFSDGCYPIEGKPRCDDCGRKLVNTNESGCTPYGSLPSNMDFASAESESKNRRWVRVQAFGPNAGGNTYDVWNRGDVCLPGQIFCAPCAAVQCGSNDGSHQCSNSNPTRKSRAECLLEPVNAYQVKGIGDSTKNVTSTIVTDDYKVKSSDYCIYKCNDDRYLYNGECIEITDICSETEYKCNGLGVEVKNKNTSSHTWECRGGGKKLETCEGKAEVGPVANIRNKISANPLKVQAMINGKTYTAACQIAKGSTDTCVFAGDKVSPGSYSIKVMTVGGKYCNLEPSGTEGKIDEQGWMGGSKNGQGYYWNCEDEDGLCDFDKSGCSGGEYELIESFTNGKTWRCKGYGKGITQTCRQTWKCNGSCSYDSSAGCVGDVQLYTNNGKGYAGFSETACKSAGYQKIAGGGVESCYLNSAIPFPYNFDPKCSGEYGGCAKWTANLKCETQIDSNNARTYDGDDALKKCDGIKDKKPSCSSSTAVGPFGVGGSSSDKGCHIKSSSTYPEGCKAAYHGGSMVGESSAVVNSNGVWSISDATNSVGLTNYCKTKTTKSDCESVGVVRHQTTSYVVRYRGATLPYKTTGGPANVQTGACCEWTSGS